jgi:hypothetical protein
LSQLVETLPPKLIALLDRDAAQAAKMPRACSGGNGAQHSARLFWVHRTPDEQASLMSNTPEIQPEPQIRELSDAELGHVSGASLMQEMMASLKLMGEMLSNVSKTRSEISMTFARNARA